jgi:hypothetical protein
VLFEVCRNGALPEREHCYFWVEWSQREFARDLGRFSPGFRQVHAALAERLAE